MSAEQARLLGFCRAQKNGAGNWVAYCPTCDTRGKSARYKGDVADERDEHNNTFHQMTSVPAMKSRGAVEGLFA